jgi:Flp pilus assembly protein TadD
VLNGLGEVLLATGRRAEARGQHAAALRAATEVGEKYEQARAHDGLASACEANGDLRQARRHWREALTYYTELGAPESEQVRARLAANG